jgi:hypothetical protein
MLKWGSSYQCGRTSEILLSVPTCMWHRYLISKGQSLLSFCSLEGYSSWLLGSSCASKLSLGSPDPPFEVYLLLTNITMRYADTSQLLGDCTSLHSFTLWSSWTPLLPFSSDTQEGKPLLQLERDKVSFRSPRRWLQEAQEVGEVRQRRLKVSRGCIRKGDCGVQLRLSSPGTLWETGTCLKTNSST